MLTNNWLKALRNRLAAGSRTSLRRRRGKTGTKVQPLEQRSLLAATPVGPEFRVNTFTTGIQGAYLGLPHSMATDTSGNFVITWNSNPEDGNPGFGIYAQRYNHSGMPQGGEFRVNSYTPDSQISPLVAMDADGDFVIAWSSKGQDGSDYGIYAKRFNAAGIAQGGEFLVNTFTTGSQSQPAVAMDANGDFLVSWRSAGQDGSLSGIYAQRYSASGLAQGNEFRVNTYTTSNQGYPSVAMDPDGEFVISWNSDGQDGGNYGIYAQRYNAVGLTQGNEFRVNSYTTSQQLYPDVAMDSSGNFVVAWNGIGLGDSSSGIYAQLYDSAGNNIGGEFRASTQAGNFKGYASVEMDSDGDFVISWNSSGQDGSEYGVYAQRYAASGVRLGREFRVNTYTTDHQWFSIMAIDADGDFIISWTSGWQDGSSDGVYAQRYRVNPTILNVLAAGDPVTANERLVSQPTSLTVAFSENMATSGVGSVTNLANWGLTRNGVSADSQLQSVSFGLNATTSQYEAVVTFAAALVPGDYVLTAKDTLTDASGRPLDGDANGTDGGNFTRAFQVRVVGGSGPEFRVNTFTAGAQRTNLQTPQNVALDDNGNYVITWISTGQDGSGYGVYAQRYNAAGVAQGTEFQVNTYTTSTQGYASVAMDADGDFVVSWSSYGQDLSNFGVYARRYNASGVAQGGEFRVNTVTPNVQGFSTIGMDDSGNFVVVWNSLGQDGSSYGVYAQRYNAAGVAQGSEFRVSSHTTNSQALSTIAMDSDGDFVVTWNSLLQDGSHYGVYAQKFNAQGVAQGSEFRVNTYTTDRQGYPSVAMDADGDFVLAWTSDGQDGSDFGIYAQRFNSLGISQGSEFRVNSYTTGAQQYSTVSMDADGDFVVTWTSYGQDGSSPGIYAQRYSRMGVPEGTEFRVNTYTTNTQRFSSVAMDSDGDFVVAWNSNGQDGSGYGMYAQRFGTNATTVLEVSAVGDTVTSNEQLVSVPQSLTVAFSNAMSTAGTGSVTNLANWGLTRNGVDSSSLLQSVTFGFSSTTNRYEAVVNFTTALTPSDFVLTVKGTMTNSNGFQLDGDANGTDGGNFTRAFQVPNVGRVGAEFRVNTSTIGNQQTNGDLAPRAVATDSQGNFVVTWYGDGSLDGSGYGIYGQRYNAAGIVQGSEFLVNTYTTGFQAYPSVAMDADGDFVVTWSSQFQDGSGFGVYGRRYNAAGAALSGEFLVNTHTTNSQYHSTVAMDADGDFVVSWTSYEQDGSRDGVYARRYNNNGVAQGAVFPVNTYTASYQGGSVVAMDADGDFVISWSSTGQDGSSEGIYARRFNAAGTALSGEFAVNTYTTSNQRNATVAMDADGDFVVTWMSNGQDGSGFGVYARRYNAVGTALSGEFLVNSYTTNSQYESRVAMDVDGDFVVTWSGNGQDGNADGVFGRRYNAAGVAQGGEFQVNTYTTGNQFWSAVAMDTDGDMVVMWTSDGQDGSGLGVYAQRFNAAAPLVQNVLTLGDPVTANEQLITAPTNMTVVFSENMATSGVGRVTDLANWRLSRGGSDVSSEIQSVTFGLNSTTNRYEALVTFTAPLTPGDYVLTAKDTLADTNGRQLDGDTNGTDGGDFNRTFRVRQIAGLGGEFRVNTYTTNGQRTDYRAPQSVAMDDAGNFVVTWFSYQDGNSYGIYAQRYNAAGVALGAEFRVNTYTMGTQMNSTVAMDSDGDFVFSWTSNGQDGSGHGIYAQRYNASGVALGGEFRVNTRTTGSQSFSTVAMDSDGDFVVSWNSDGQDGSGYGIYAQRYNAAGVAQGGEFKVNTYATNSQWYSNVAMDTDGDFVITWTSSGSQDGSSDGIYAQRYNAAGAAQGGEFKVNSYTTNYQAFSSVAMDADGDFVVTWFSGTQDGGGDGIFAQRYNSAGVAQGAEFRVNTYTTSNQRYSTVAVDADGDFVISWSSNGQAGTNYGIYAQRYNAAGVAQGTEFSVNTFTNWQRFSTVAVDADGDFVITWSSDGQDGSGYGVYAQRFGKVISNAAPTLALQNVVSSLPENTSTTGGIKVADIVVTDDSVGLIRLRLTGPQASSFEIVGNELRIKSGIVLDYEILSSYSVNVILDDELLGSGAEATEAYTLGLINLREPGAKVGDEFRVNTYTTNSQRTEAESPQSVAMDDAGNYVITWSSQGQDGSGSGIYARRYNAAGVAQGTEFRVNSYTTSQQKLSTVAMDADGDFVITWSSQGQDGSGYGIYAQRYNAGGAAQGTEFRVNTYTTFNQRFSSIAMDSDGNFVISWTSEGQDGSSNGIYAQRYNSSGMAQGNEFSVNTYTTNNQQYSTLAMDSDGDFVITWSSKGQDGSDYGIYAQRFSAAGVAWGSEFRVNTYTSSSQRFSTVAMNLNGSFVISWDSDQDGNSFGIYAQHYNSSGVSQGSEFRVNSNTSGIQRSSTVAMDASGDFVIAWSSFDQDGSNYGIYARRYDAAGVVQGDEFRANTYVSNNQVYSTVAMDADGDLVIAWYSIYQDGSFEGIYAQRFDAAPPVVNVVVTSPNGDSTPDVVIAVTDTGAGILESEPVVIDIDLNNDGDYADAGELNYASGTLSSGTATITLPTLVDGTYGLRARAYDKADNEGTSSSQTLVISTNAAPTAVTLTNTITSVNENTATPLRVADVSITDDGRGVNLLSLTGADASYFFLSGGQLFFKTLPSLDFETKSSYQVAVSVDDASVGGSPDATSSLLTIQINDVNEAPTAVTLTNTVTAVNENTTTPLGVANIVVTDDALGVNNLTLTGPDASYFEISGNQIVFKSTTSLNFEAKSSYQVGVSVDDASVGGSPDATSTLLTIQINNVNETPTTVALSGTSLPENQPTSATVGQFSTTDPDSGNVFTYTLVPGLSGQPANADSFHSAISGNGRFLVFSSAADNLVPGDNNQRADIFRRDLVTGEIVLVTTGPNGQSNSQAFEPSISDDGRFIAFSTNAFNLASGDTNGANDIYVKDMQTGNVTLVSTGVNGIGNGNSFSPAISGNGRYVAFYSDASNLVAGDSNGTADVFVKDLQTGTMTLVSTGVNGQGSGFSQTPSISSDGRYVAFFSYASNLVTGDTNGRADVFVKDLQTGTLTLVSVATSGQSNGFSFNPSISADGRFVAFHSDANNLVSGDTNGVYDVFVRDLQSGATTLVSISGATVSNGQSQNPAISSDGRYVAFESDGANLVAGDSNGTRDVFLKDLQSGTVTRISQAASGTSGNNLSYDAAISGDGARVVFTSSAANLVVGDTNAVSDVFVRNVSTTSIDLGSVSPGDHVFFTMNGDVLKTRRPFNFEQKSSYSIRVRSTDQGGLWFEKDFTITVTNVNEFPLSTSLSNSSLDENAATATVVGLLSTIDTDSGNTFTYSFVDGGPWDADNSAFAIVGNELRTSRPLDFETQGSYVIRIRTVDQGGLEIQTEFTITVNDLVEDITAPTSLITALPAASNSLTLNIAVTGSDPGVGASGVLEYDLYYSTGGAFVLFETVPAGTSSTTFTGLPNTTYWFRSLARDNAGNVEAKISADTYTRIGDVVPPSTQVTTSVPTSSGLFTVQITGNKPSGTPITAFDVYVVIDSGEPILVGSASSVATGGGNYSGVILFQGILDGVSHTYRFFSRGRDGSGNVEAAPVSGDVSVTYSFASAGLTATAIDVQNGVNQRSYLRYLDVLFSTSTGLSDLLATGRVKVERFGIDATAVDAGTGAAVTGFGLVQNGNKLRLDFGLNGLGGLRQAGNGFYRILLDLDGNGTFADAGDRAFEFHRLFGDANGNGTVDVADTNLVTSQIGRVGANLDGDLDGNGSVNSTDRLYTTQQRGKKLLDPLLSWLDD